MTHVDNGLGPGRNYREMAVFTFCQKSTQILIFIWKKGTIFFVQLCPVVARTWFRLRSVFLGAQNFGFWLESLFFFMRKPVFGTETRLALNRILTPTDIVYDFLFRSYACFRKKTWLTHKKVFPHPTMRALCPCNSPAPGLDKPRKYDGVKKFLMKIKHTRPLGSKHTSLLCFVTAVNIRPRIYFLTI